MALSLLSSWGRADSEWLEVWKRWVQLSRLLCILPLITWVSLQQYYFQLTEVSSSPLFVMTTSNKKDFFFSISNQAEKSYVYIPNAGLTA